MTINALRDREPDVALRSHLQVLLIGGAGQAEVLRRRVESAEVRVATAEADEGLTQLLRAPPDVVMLPLGVDPAPGIELLRLLRAVSQIGVITLGTGDRVLDGITALEAGADDHLGSPFGHAELLARLRAVVRRTQPAPSALVTTAGMPTVEVDLARHQVCRDGQPVHLTRTELDLLEVLASNPGVLLDHRALLKHVWGDRYGTEANYLRVYIAQLRKKLGDDASAPRLIETEPGIGYRWVAAVAPREAAVLGTPA